MNIVNCDLRKYSFILLCRALGITIEIKRPMYNDTKPFIIVSNHISYTDILILGSIFNAGFIAKSSISKWPLIGWIAKCFKVIFINRKQSGSSDDLKIMLNNLKYDNIIFFPEGTTNNGCKLLPFKSVFFNIPAGHIIQPVSINYARVNHLPARRFNKKLLSWIGDISLITHLDLLLQMKSIHVIVTLHDKIISDGNRKSICNIAFDAIKQGL